MTKNEALARIQDVLKSNHVVLFMKGTPTNPKCCFSADASKRLNNAGIEYKSVDVSADTMLFDSLRQYTNYTHFPQMFVDGRFIGSNENINKYITKNKV